MKSKLSKKQMAKLHGGFLPALLAALAPSLISPAVTGLERLFTGKNIFTGNGQGQDEILGSTNSYILGSGKTKKGGASVGAGTKKGAQHNPWIQHVKAYAKKHNIKYSEAISKAKSSYHKAPKRAVRKSKK